MTPKDWPADDDFLLAELGRALPADADLVERIACAAKGAYAWRTVDAELASLAYDSAVHGELAGARSEAASLWVMTFESGSLLVQLGVTEGALVGQLVPARSYEVVMLRPRSDPVPVGVDELGCFRIAPVPHGSFSLRIRIAEGVTVATDWISL
jgi:hypothetical protein